MTDAGKPKVVVLGGGNGTSRLLEALKPQLDAGEISSLHALVLNADDGGSTGRLREQYDVSAMGDLTKCLMALSNFHGDIRGEQFLQALDHRFDRGDFSGHTMRNMFLTALEMTRDSVDDALAMMARLLTIPKNSGVVPTTLRPLTQQVVADGQVLGEGQHFISHNVNLQADPAWQPGAVQVQFAEGDVDLNPRAAAVLEAATHIIVAPGHTYGTILPTLALQSLQRTITRNSAKLIVVMDLLTTPHRTDKYPGEDFVRVYEAYLGRSVDVVVGNTGTTDTELVPGQAWVRFGEQEHTYELILDDVVSSERQQQTNQDSVPRAIVIHDAGKMKQLLQQLLS